jgi:hypothetical protein
MGAWGRRHTPVSKELSVRAQVLEEGGPKLLVPVHEGAAAYPFGRAAPQVSVFAQLQAAYEAAIAEAETKSQE